MIVAKKGRIYEARCARGWTQKELANKSDVSAARICAIESSSAPMTPQTAKKIADAVGKDFDELFDVVHKGEQ